MIQFNSEHGQLSFICLLILAPDGSLKVASERRVPLGQSCCSVLSIGFHRHIHLNLWPFAVHTAKQSTPHPPWPSLPHFLTPPPQPPPTPLGSNYLVFTWSVGSWFPTHWAIHSLKCNYIDNLLELLIYTLLYSSLEMWFCIIYIGITYYKYNYKFYEWKFN